MVADVNQTTTVNGVDITSDASRASSQRLPVRTRPEPKKNRATNAPHT